MRKTQIALAAVALVASSAALAANVTISGVIDIGVGQSSGNGNSGGMFLENGAYNDHSGINLNVSEDMGGGLKAYGSLGMGFNPSGQSDNPGTALTVNNGNIPADVAGINLYRNNSLFNRQTYVGLSGEFGSVQLGRQLSPFIISNASFMLYNGMFGVGRMAMHGNAGTASGDDGGFFRDNIIQYVTPSIAGFTGTVFYQAPNSTRGNAFINDTGRYTAYSIAGPIGPVKFTTAYHKQSYSQDAARDQEEYNGWNIGGVVPVTDQVDLALGYISTRTGVATNPKADSWNVGLGYAFTETSKITLQHAATNSVNAQPNTTLTNVMVSNALSKRTTLYAGYGRGNGIGATIGTLGIVDRNGSDNTFGGNTIQLRDGVRTSNSAFVLGVSHSF